jgi:hypothetical protein
MDGRWRRGCTVAAAAPGRQNNQGVAAAVPTVAGVVINSTTAPDFFKDFPDQGDS